MPTKKKTLRMHLAGALRAEREKAGMSQEALAHVAGLHRTFVGQVERAQRNISIDNVERLVKALDIDPVELVGGWYVARKNKSH